MLQAHAQNYKPLASILTSKDLGDAGFSEAVVRCGALSGILKIKMDQVQAGGHGGTKFRLFSLSCK